MREGMLQLLNISLLASEGPLGSGGLVGNALLYHATMPYGLEREEHIAHYFNGVWILVIGLVVALDQYERWIHREKRGLMEIFTLNGGLNGSLDESPSEDINETPLLKALGGHDLSRQIEGTPASSSHSTPNFVRLKNPLKGLEAPRAKGRSEPVARAHIPKGDHKALVIGLDGPVAHKDRSLDYAVRDAKLFEKRLKELNDLGQQSGSHLSGHFDFKIQVLTDEGGKIVPRTEVFKALRALFDGAKSDDLLVLFFSGHCCLTKPNGVVSLMTVEENQSYRLVPSTVFSEHINKLPPGCTVEVFLDCCYSSGLIQVNNIIRKMTPDSAAPGSINGSSPSEPTGSGTTPSTTPASRGCHTYGTFAAPIRKDSNSSKCPSTSADTPGTSRGPTQAGLQGPRPGIKINTEASVIIWAASDADEKAYESPTREGGPLTLAVCDEIKNSVDMGEIVGREQLWNRVRENIKHENDEYKRGIQGQHARVLASSQNSEEIMNTPLFCIPPGSPVGDIIR
ncbi:unnamed protein product [Rhizoctonia solani]|uniref:Peptidase C14 caspase domain-containing protein n=1 Tax=Rhizoctonia solani TaxID=456999 RepID=A0A8H3HET1_9AGAM|nr:unnamed protein product [Rhizoctonia solani]